MKEEVKEVKEEEQKMYFPSYLYDYDKRTAYHEFNEHEVGAIHMVQERQAMVCHSD